MREAFNSAVDGLKGSPGFLALVLLNVIVFGVVYLATQANEDRHAALTLRILDSCLDRVKS